MRILRLARVHLEHVAERVQLRAADAQLLLKGARAVADRHSRSKAGQDTQADRIPLHERTGDA